MQCAELVAVFPTGSFSDRRCICVVVPADNPLPPLAQVAEQQGKYLAHILNEEAAHMNPWQGGQGSPAASKQVGLQWSFAGKAAADTWVAAASGSRSCHWSCQPGRRHEACAFTTLPSVLNCSWNPLVMQECSALSTHMGVV
jgi:hypothetical protein